MAKVVALENLPEVKLLENITRETAQRVIQELSAYKGQKVALSIFSVGGDVLASKAIGSYIGNEANGLTVEARVYGNAFSGALIICAHCQAAYIAAGSFALGHEAYASDDEGNKIPADKLSDELRSTLEAMNADQVDLFAKRTKKKKDTIERWMKEDRHMSAEDATEFGLFDGIIPQAARLAAYANINKPMADEKKVRTFKVSRASLLASAAKGLTTDVHNAEVEIPEDQIEASNATKLAELNTEIDGLKAKLATAETEKATLTAAKTTLETEKAAEVTAKAALEAENITLKAEKVKLDIALAALKKDPLRAQTLPDGTQVVIPGGEPEKKEQMSASAAHAKAGLDAYANYFKSKQQATA